MSSGKKHANLIRLKYLTMKFTSIPDNGSAWSDKLIYVIDTEKEEPIHLVVDIVDVDRDTTLGRCRLYNVTNAEVNIAPYLRSRDNFRQVGSCTPMAFISPASRNIAVVVNGNVSPSRLFYRVPLDCSKAHTLSTITTTQTLSLGEPIRLTVFSRDGVCVTVEYSSATRYLGTNIVEEGSDGSPLEIIIPTAMYPKETERIKLLVQDVDGNVLQRTIYCIVERAPSARRLMWYNRLGGVECYTFPTSARTRYKARGTRSMSVEGLPVEMLSREEHYRLTTAREVEAEMNRIAEIVFSPRLYELRGEDIIELELASREILFDRQGSLHQLSIDVYEKEGGGVVC